jgi:ligand-binding sensor domain-containing protein
VQPRLPSCFRISKRWTRYAAVLLAGGLAVAFWITFIWVRAAHVLRDSAKLAQTASQIPFTLEPLRMPASGFEYFTTPANYRNAAVFNGRLFVTGSSALFEMDKTGRPQKIWRVGQDLPSAPLTAIAVRTGIGVPELWIGTNGSGLLIYNGQSFRQLLPGGANLRNITALLALADGRVLVGTPEAGLYVTDGKRLKLFHAEFAKTEVTALAGSEDALWVGTRTRGVALWQGGEVTRFANELPDPQVLSIATNGSNTWVGTPVGVAEFTQGQFRRRMADGFFAEALGVRGSILYVGTLDEGLAAVNVREERPRPEAHSTETGTQPIMSFADMGDALLAISPDSIRQLPGDETVVRADAGMLTAGHIAALHVDDRGQLWVGYFDRGLDIVPLRDPSKKRHFEDDRLFCVNRVKESEDGRSVAVATANGLAIFDAGGHLRQVLDRTSGLIASNVTDVLFGDGPDSLMVATPAGLSFVDRGRVTSMYAFEGLVNNHVYTLAKRDDELFAGTLGGFSLLKNGLVEASYTTANSALRQNWITASAEFGGDLYIGTYGSGVVRLTRQGELTAFREFGPRQERVEVNPNAMLSTPGALYVGTAGRGLAVLRNGSSRWVFLTEGLPSLNVTALAAKDGALYVGTDNGLVRMRDARNRF